MVKFVVGAYNYKLCYRPGKQLANADALSCLPMIGAVAYTPPPLEVLLLEGGPEAPMHPVMIAAATLKYAVLSRVLHWVLNRYPSWHWAYDGTSKGLCLVARDGLSSRGNYQTLCNVSATVSRPSESTAPPWEWITKRWSHPFLTLLPDCLVSESELKATLSPTSYTSDTSDALLRAGNVTFSTTMPSGSTPSRTTFTSDSSCLLAGNCAGLVLCLGIG